MKNNTAKKRKKKGKKLIWIILFLIVAGIGIVVLKNRGNQAPSVPTVQVTKAYRGELQEELSVVGTVKGQEVITVYAPADGDVKEVFVRSGEEVKAGTILFSYDLDKLEEALYQAKLQNEKTQLSFDNTIDSNKEGKGKVKEANVNLPVLKQQIADHENYLNNLQTELSDYLTNKSNESVIQSYNLKKQQAQLQQLLSNLTPGTDEYNKVTKDLESVLEQVESATLSQSIQAKSDRQKELEKQIEEEQETIAELKNYQAKMEAQKNTGEATVLDKYDSRQLEIDMELTELAYQKQLEEAELAKQGVSAKYQGVVTSINVAPGSKVGSGVQLMTIERTDQMKISAMASKYVLERLEVGQKVDAVIGEKTYPAKVSHIDRFAQPGALSGTTAVGFEVELLEVSEKIYLGAEAKMDIFAGKAENELLVPTAAVRANKDGDFVYVVQDGKVVKKSITTGIITKGKAVILSGITENDELVVEYPGDIEEGMEVLTIQASPED